jgi:DNA mismatch endonuclease (patch repair protein)
VTARLDDVKPLRRRIMSAVGQRDTKPKMIVRRLLYSMNYRYRLHQRHLPGRPDIVFSSRRKAIFVHGCFWHRHPGCLKATSPKTRADFWSEKFDRNVERDQNVEQRLADLGWNSLVVWECETRTPDALSLNLRAFLENTTGRETVGRIAA